MDLKTALRALVDAAPPDATVTVRWLGELLASEQVTDTAQPAVVDALAVDLTVEQVAARFGKGTSTVRTWIGRGELEGAYRMHGHEWRVPLAAVAALQRSQAAAHAQRSTATRKSRHAPDLGEWRRHAAATAHPAVHS